MKDYKVQWHKYNMEQMDLFSSTFCILIFEGRNNCSQKAKLLFYTSTSKYSRTQLSQRFHSLGALYRTVGLFRMSSSSMSITDFHSTRAQL